MMSGECDREGGWRRRSAEEEEPRAESRSEASRQRHTEAHITSPGLAIWDQRNVRISLVYHLQTFTIARRMANPRVAANVPQNTAATVEPEEKMTCDTLDSD